MRTTPIFDQLRDENLDGPLCRFCGAIWLTPFSEPGNVCNQCYIRRCDTEPERWRCFDCDEFLGNNPRGRMTLIHQGIALTLCREHYDWRAGEGQ